MKTLHLFVFAFMHLTVATCCLIVAIAIALIGPHLPTAQLALYLQAGTYNKGRFEYSSVAPDSVCHFLRAVPFTVFAVSLLLMVYHLYLAFVTMRNQKPRYQIWNVVCLYITTVIGIVLLIASCIISIGFNYSCTTLRNLHEKEYQNLSCEVIFSLTVFEGDLPEQGLEEGIIIYNLLTITEVISWIACFGSAISICLSSYLIFLRREKRASEKNKVSTVASSYSYNLLTGHI